MQCAHDSFVAITELSALLGPLGDIGLLQGLLELGKDVIARAVACVLLKPISSSTTHSKWVMELA